jgi:hypothetical protein
VTGDTNNTPLEEANHGNEDATRHSVTGDTNNTPLEEANHGNEDATQQSVAGDTNNTPLEEANHNNEDVVTKRPRDHSTEDEDGGREIKRVNQLDVSTSAFQQSTNNQIEPSSINNNNINNKEGINQEKSNDKLPIDMKF